MPRPDDTADTGRRNFLKLATVAAPAAVAATVVPVGEAEAAAPARDSSLQDTAHVRAYYASARF